MKRILLTITALLLISNFSFGQYKGYDDKGPSGYNKSSGNLLLGFINPKNFTMHQTFSVSMMNTGYGNVSLTSYINSMNYRLSSKLDVSADVKFQYSPFASSGLGSAYTSALQKNLSGIFLSSAALNYKISDNSFIRFEYRNIDASDYYNNFYNPFSRYNSDWR